MTLSKKEAEYLNSRSLCCLATASKQDSMPHVVPVIYTMDENGNFIIAIDYGTKKLKNLRENRHVALLITDPKAEKCVMVQGECVIRERGSEYLRLLKILFDRFDFYRQDPWGEGESPILKIKPEKVVSWGI